MKKTSLVMLLSACSSVYAELGRLLLIIHRILRLQPIQPKLRHQQIPCMN